MTGNSPCSPANSGILYGRFRDVFDAHAADTPVLLTSPGIRAAVRSIVERVRPATPVLAQTEISTRARVKTLATI